MNPIDILMQQARNEGHFRTIKGRGKPLSRDTEHSNPFIAREEFLMNRIVQRQGAAPPWVEYQAGKSFDFSILSPTNLVPFQSLKQQYQRSDEPSAQPGSVVQSATSSHPTQKNISPLSHYQTCPLETKNGKSERRGTIPKPWKT